MHSFCAITRPLHNLTCKNESFAWIDFCQLMYEKLKYCVLSAPILKIYDSSSNTWVDIHTNASTKALSAILIQKCAAANNFHPIAYYSKNFKKNRITQLWIMKFWLLWKLYSIGNHTYMVRGLLHIWTITPLRISWNNQILPLSNYIGP